MTTSAVVPVGPSVPHPYSSPIDWRTYRLSPALRTSGIRETLSKIADSPLMIVKYSFFAVNLPYMHFSLGFPNPPSPPAQLHDSITIYAWNLSWIIGLYTSSYVPVIRSNDRKQEKTRCWRCKEIEEDFQEDYWSIQWQFNNNILILMCILLILICIKLW